MFDFLKNKKILSVLYFIVLFICVSCEVLSESEKQKYYTPSKEQIIKNVFENDSIWICQIFLSQSKKGVIYEYNFFSDMTYKYIDQENIYEDIWNPTKKTWSGKVDVLDSKMIFYGYNADENEMPVEISENGNYLKIGGITYKRNAI